MKKWLALWKYRTQRYFSAPLQTKYMLVEAAVLLGVSRAIVLLLPFRFFAPYLGQQSSETSHAPAAPQQQIASRVMAMIDMVSPRTPWNSNCLAQAITGKLMLRSRGVPSTLYMGLRNEAAELKAHAWLRAGDMFVTGGVIASQYKVVTFYGK
ncbi:MAG: lasso peptide biosynthesis B2 protein [Candidatus Promineifilaceae bacterium]